MEQVKLHTSELHKQNLEWGGQLNRASTDPHLFSLYLAMHLQPGNPTITFDPEKSQTADSSQWAETRNHYRRASTHLDQSNIKTANTYSELVTHHDTASVMLWRAMHPDPLSAKDNHRHVSPEILANCSYATQQRWRSESVDTTLEENPAMLNDIISGCESLLV